jgi:Nif-specific regulatory protein
VHPLFDPAYIAALKTDDSSIMSFIGVPIRTATTVVGTLTIDRVWDGRSDFRFDADVRFLTMVANLIGQTVELHRFIARDRNRLIAESHRLQKELSDIKPSATKGRRPIGGIIGDSAAIRSVLDSIAIIAKSHSSVLLRGESGTGKELFARVIHEMSACASGPFIKVNCAALPESVLESELFGHEKGSFTGALAMRKGRFELADHGTLFLDEIGDISLSFQAKLLRVLQEGEFERVGGNHTIKVDVRLVTATNKNLEEAVSKGEFRADLYYRINVVPLNLPPLRDRKSDIPLLAKEFLKRFNSENGRDLVFAPGAIDVMLNCYFPGNVRELENCVQRTATLARGQSITGENFACTNDQCLSSMLWKGSKEAQAGARPRPGVLLPIAPQPASTNSAPRACATADRTSVSDVPSEGVAPAFGPPVPERDRLIDAMERSGWVQAKAARMLGLTSRQVGYAIKKHDIKVKHF